MSYGSAQGMAKTTKYQFAHDLIKVQAWKGTYMSFVQLSVERHEQICKTGHSTEHAEA